MDEFLKNKKCYLNGNITILSAFTAYSGAGRPGAGSKLSKLKKNNFSVKYIPM